jgi:four helix bundle protein
MKILLHICCANCGIYPLERINERGDKVVGYFFNPNIHPYQEYQKRLESLRQYSENLGLEVVYRDEYLLEEFLRNVAQRPEERCQYCYSVRLEATAREAKKRGFDQFSTTLLQSTHQNHQLIKETGERVAKEVGIPFYYEDFRQGWKRGVEVSKAMGLYRQQYCGCIYSEKERFANPRKMPNGKVQGSKEIQNTNVKGQDSNDTQNSDVKVESSRKIQSSNEKIYDLEERTGRFGEMIIEFVKTLERNEINRPLIGQLVEAGTSIGANYMEADGAESKKDFKHKIAICKKEAKETKHWLRMIRKGNPNKVVECHKLWQEAHELTLIFSSIFLSKEKKGLDI